MGSGVRSIAWSKCSILLLNESPSWKKISRRELLGSVVADGTLGFEELAWATLAQIRAKDPLARARPIGVVEFSHEAPVAMETALGEGFDGRMYTELSRLTPEASITANESFYVRMRTSAVLHEQEKWMMQPNGIGNEDGRNACCGLKKWRSQWAFM